MEVGHLENRSTCGMFRKLFADTYINLFGKLKTMITIDLSLKANLQKDGNKFTLTFAKGGQIVSHSLSNVERHMLGNTTRDHNMPGLNHSDGSRTHGERIDDDHLLFTTEKEGEKIIAVLSRSQTKELGEYILKDPQ